MGALDGLLVVAVEQAVAAPLATSRLADAGARVIKVERAEGDFARGYDRAAAGESSYFIWLNQGKESIALDLKAPADRDLLARMIARADVLVQNLAPGAMGRMGLGAASLRARHPGLIVCDISGYGHGDGVAGLKAYDMLVQAESGLIGISGAPGAPGRIGVSVCDIGAGMAAHAAILEALIARGRSGEGRHIEISLFDVAAWWMTVPYLHHAAGTPPEPAGLAHPSIAPYEAFGTADGGEIIIAVQNDREWVRLCAALGVPEIADHPSFRTNNARVRHRAAMRAALEARTRAMSTGALIRLLGDAGIAFGRVNPLAALADHPALRRGNFGTPTGEVAAPAVPGTESGPSRRVPWIDEHGPAIRAEFG